MTRIEQLKVLEQQVRRVLREAYLHGAARMGHSELALSLGRERTTKGFHSDIKHLWINEMELLGYDDGDLPGLRYCWVPGVNEWVFVFEGKTDDDKLEWTVV